MANYINHQQARQGIENAIARRQYNNSLEGSLNNTIQNALRDKIGLDTLENDQKSIANRLVENIEKVKREEYVDPKEYDSLVAESENIGKRLGYLRNYLRNADPNNAEAIKEATDASKNFLDASKAMADQQKFYSAFKDADDYKKQMDAYKEQQRLTFDYDLNAGKSKLDAAKGTKEYDKLKAEYETAKYFQDDYKYEQLKNNEDFADKSKKAKTKFGFDTYGEGAWAADYINGKWYSKFAQGLRNIGDSINFLNNDKLTERFNRYDFMTDDQVDTFNYIFNTEGQDAAQKYLDHIESELAQKYVKANKTDNWFVNTQRAINAGTESIGEGLENLILAGMRNNVESVEKAKGTGNEWTKYWDEMIKENAAPSNSAMALEARKKEASGIEKFWYDVAQTAPNTLVNMFVPFGLGTVITSLSAAGNAYAQATIEEKSTMERSLMALGEGSMEAVTNAVQKLGLKGIEKLGTGTKVGANISSKLASVNANMSKSLAGSVTKTLGKYGYHMFSEGLEEGIQEIASTELRNAIYGENNELDWGEIGYNSLLGAASAGILQGGPTAANVYRDFKLPPPTESHFKETFDTAPKDANFDTRYSTFMKNLDTQDSAIAASVIMNAESGNTEKANEIIDDAIKTYEFAKEYNSRHIHADNSEIDSRIAELKSLKKHIANKTLNIEAAKTAAMQGTALWQIGAENNDAAAKLLLQKGLSNTQIEKTVLSDAGIQRGFLRLTGVNLSQYKTVSRKRNAFRVTAQAYQEIASSDIAKQVTEILKANNSQTDAAIRSENRVKAQKLLEEAYRIASAEDKQARDSGNVQAAKIAQTKMQIIRTTKDNVRNGNTLAFASLDGSVAVNNARKYTESAPKVEPKHNSMAVDRDLEAARETVSDEYTKIFEDELDKTNSFNEAEKAVLENIDDKIDHAEGDEKTELIEQRKKLKEYINLERAKNAEVQDLIKQYGREEFNRRAKRFQKTLKQYGIDLEIENGGELYYDENKTLISKEKYDELKKQGKKVSVVFQNGIHTERTIKIFDALSYGRYIRTLDFNTGEITMLRSGLDFNAREGVDFVIGHELVHEGETVNSGIVKSILDSIGNTMLDSYYEIGKRRAGKKTSAEADKHWNDLKELYIKAEMKNGDRAAAEAKVTDAYMYEEIAADYMGMLLAKSGNIDNLASKSGLLTNIKIAMKSLIGRLKGEKLDVRAERVKELMKKLDTVVQSTYGKLAKTTEDAQKSTESEAKTEVKQTPTETEKRAENEEKMMVVGESAETADQFDADGWWLGKDGKWRYEIADNEMRFERNGLYKNPQTLEDYIEHDKLFEAYPHLRNIRVEYVDTIDGKPTVRGNYSREQNRILLKKGMPYQQTKETLIHEIQHAVQTYEGFVGGSKTDVGYVEWFNQVFDKVKDTREYKSLKTPKERRDYVDNVASLPGEEAIEKAARAFYRNNYGENEARATAERIDMSKEQRRKSPIVNNGNVYSTEAVRSKFVDNLRSMGYTDSQIHQELNGDEINGRTEEIGSGTRGRSAQGKYIATDISRARSSRNLNTRGEGTNQGLVHDGRVKYSLSEAESDGAYSKIYDMQAEVNELTRKIADWEQSDDFKTITGALYKATSEDDLDKAMKAYLNWKNESGYAEMVTKRDTMRDELQKLRKDYYDNLANEAVKKEQEDIAKSGLSEAEYFRKQAVKEFGYTPYFYDAGYITPNGKMLNFSGEKGKHFGSRGEDHRAIGIIYADTQGTDALNRFVNDGNIRIMAETPGLDVSASVEPTSEQYSTIRKFANEYSGKGYFAVDFSDENGRSVGTLEYENHINATRIINDIKYYYETGEVREQSNIDKFRYSVAAEMDADYLTAVENGDMETAHRLVDEAAKNAGYSSRMYHGAKNGGGFTVFRDWGYFTENKAYAERYAQRENEKSLYEVFVKIDNPFDTRDAETREIFESDILPEYGASQIQESGLPDWTDGYDIADYIDENGLDYDTIVLDEGGDLVNGVLVSRGLSYVIKKSAQVKSADPIAYDDNGNVIPLSERFNESNDDIRYSLTGVTADGIEVYETSDEIMNMSEADRKKHYLDLVKNDYRGRTARFQKNGHTYYAGIDIDDAKKQMYGEKRSSQGGSKALVRTLADGSVFDLVENSEYYHGSKEQGKTTKAHKNVIAWDYFVKTVQIDGKVYDLVADVKKTADGEYVYTLHLTDNTKIKAAPAQTRFSGSSKVAETASMDSVSQNDETVNTQDEKMSISEEILDGSETQTYAELTRELEKLKARNERLAHEFVKTHGKEVDRRSATKLLSEIIEKYQGTIKAKDLLAKFEDAFAYVNTKGATVDVLMEKLNEIATDIFDSAIEYDESFKEYSELLTDLRTTGITVSEQDRGGDFDDVGGWNEFRKKNFGSIKFVNDGKVMIDSKYQELATKYPEWFDDGITNPAEQAKEIASVARKLRELGMTPKDVYDGVDGQIVVNGIMGDLYSALKDADKAEQKIADTHALDSMYYRRKISEIRKRNQERERQMAEAFHIRLHNLTQDRHKAYQEKVLRSRAKDLAKRAVHPTKTKHVPEYMKGDVLKFLSKIPWASDNKGHTLYADEMRELVRNAPKAFTDPESEETDEINTFTKELLKDISSYSPPLDNKGRIKSVENMDADEIYEINEMLMRMIHEINTADKIFHSTAKASALATKAITQFNSNRKDREYAGSRLVEFIKYGAADPEAFFNVLNVPVLTEAYHNLAKRQDVFARTLRDLTNDMREITGGAIPKSWREDYGNGQTLASGQKVFLTPVQKMTLYLLSKQEASKKRLLSERGGIVPTDTKREFVWHTKENGKEKIKLSVPKTSLGKLAHLTQGDLDLIIGTLTEEQIKMADKISGLLNGKCAALGNEVSLAEEGYRKFIVENYFPMMVAETGRTYDELVTRAKDEIARKPFTKDRTGTAGVPLVIEDIFSVMDRHLLGMSQYYAYDEALRDFQRILRLRPEGQGSLELTMKGHFGNKGNKVNTFLSNFIKDVQGAQMQVGEETLLSEKFLSTYKAAQVAGNLSVVAKQPTAIFRAMPEFSAKGMAAMMNFATTKADIKAMIENSGLAQLKDWGFSENTTAKSVAELYDKNATNWRGKLDDIFSWGAEKADMITWAAIWRASVADTKSLSEAIDKFNDVIRKTQVVKSAFTSSRIAEQGGFAKLAFAFKNEPLKTFNYIRSTINDVAEGKEGAKKKAFAVTVATAINTAVVAAISAGFSLIRDDEEDSAELFAEKFKENVIADLISNSTILLGDIWTAVESAMNGREVERMDLAVFTDAAQFARNFIDMFKKPESEQKNTWMKIVYDGARTVSNFTGIPIGNVIRAIKSVHGRVVELSDDPVARYNMTKIWYNVEGVDNASIRAKFRSILTDALDEGNYKAFAEINNDLRRHGFSASDIEKAVSNSARLYDAWNKGAEAFRGEVNKAIKVAPMLSSTYVMEAFKSKKTALVNDLYDAMKSGSKKATSDARNALLKHRDVDTKRVLTESDVDKLITKKIESAIKSEVKSKLADLYGTESYDAVKKKILNEYRHFEMITPEYIDKLARSLS